ncbi:NUDIX hydrolase [Spiractinospora alimapuensis]|nr:NUDIX hydrolase [Spiractinospora alimapuensis]
MARPLAAAGVLFRDGRGRVLLVTPTYKPSLEIPGGLVEPDETPYQAAVREVEEELGVRPPIGGLLVVDWAPHPAHGDKVLFIFDGGVLDVSWRARITPDGEEISEAQFVETSCLSDVLIDRLARRVHAAVKAQEAGTPRYLENGTSIGWSS